MTVLTKRTPHRRRLAGVVAVTVLTGLGAASSAQAAVFTVQNTADAGANSLRDAITQANAAAGADEIHFNIPGAGANRHVIHLASDLPAVTDEIDIRGYSQPGAVKALAGVPALIKIVIDAGQVNNGLVLQTDDSLVRGLVIHTASGAAPDGDGLRVDGDRNEIEGNYFGLDGTNNNNFLFGNDGDGLQITGDDNVVGGTAAEDRNVIAANGKIAGTSADGVSITGDRNTVKGNAIGTDPLMTTGQIGNSEAGVRLNGDDNKVGGASSGAANVISGNSIGVHVESGTGNELKGNLIGTDSTGTVALGNSEGVVVDAPETLVGDALAGAGNTVAGSPAGPGLRVSSAGNTVQGNKIGTNAAGTGALANLGGMRVTGSNNVIGGVAANAGNLVSGNLFYGMTLDAPAAGNRVQGNLVGTDAAGVVALPNAGDGIRVIGGNDNTIGGLLPGVGNVVAFNDGNGVEVDSGTGNTVTRNSISDNLGLGIDLGGDDLPTANDAADADSGANGLVNFPEVDAATTAGGVTTVDWRLDDALPLVRFRIDFYANDVCDGSGHGEGKTFLGSAFATTNGAGDVGATTTMFTSAAVGQQVVATATVAPLVLPPDPQDTSEFSACRQVT
jgi:hypothetical protein